MKFNITLRELETAIKFSKKYGVSKFKTISLIVNGGGVGDQKLVSRVENDKPIDITDYESF